MGDISYFEVPVNDVERAKKFYKEVLGWDIKKTKMPGSPPDYFDISTGKGAKGSLNMGGLYKRSEPKQVLTNYATVEDIDLALSKAQKLGASVVAPKMAIKGIGQVASITDNEGNVIGIWQPEKK